MKYLLWVLLALHVLWGSTHLVLHAKGFINPWKLGGYGMYTVPSPKPRVEFEFLNSDKEPNVNYFDFRDDNIGFYFRKWLITVDSLQSLITENPKLIGADFRLMVTEQFLVKESLSAERKITHEAQVIWNSDSEYTAIVRNSFDQTKTYILRR